MNKTLRDFFAQSVFTTSETKVDYYHQKVNVRVMSQVAERFKTQDLKKLVNFKKIPEILGFDGDYPVVHPKSQILTFFGKKLQKISCKIFHRKTYFAQKI